ncbi:MAG TPA: hypothetical protein VGH38_05030, partial [Bryobacteraceae bacterium]
MQVDLDTLGFDEGGHLLVKRALRSGSVGEEIVVTGTAPELETHLRAWCRSEGHSFRWLPDSLPHAHAVLVRGGSEADRWAGSQRAGAPGASQPRAVADHPPRSWGLAARGARVEAGSPEFGFTLVDKSEVWSDDAARIYAQAAAAQWDPQTAVPWTATFNLPDEVEDAVVQVMTYLIENETAALIVPSRFIAQLH